MRVSYLGQENLFAFLKEGKKDLRMHFWIPFERSFDSCDMSKEIFVKLNIMGKVYFFMYL